MPIIREPEIDDRPKKPYLWDDEKGDAFHCRCETYLTDPKIEPRKSEWEVEVAIKLTDNQPKEKEL